MNLRGRFSSLKVMQWPPQARFFTEFKELVAKGERRRENETAGERVDQAGGDIHAGALPGDMEPDVIKIAFGQWRYNSAPSHGANSAIRRAPRARATRESSRVARNATRRRSRSSH